MSCRQKIIFSGNVGSVDDLRVIAELLMGE